MRLALAELRVVVGTVATSERAASGRAEPEPSSSTVGSRRDTRLAPQKVASDSEALVAPAASSEKQSVAASGQVAPQTSAAKRPREQASEEPKATTDDFADSVLQFPSEGIETTAAGEKPVSSAEHVLLFPTSTDDTTVAKGIAVPSVAATDFQLPDESVTELPRIPPRPYGLRGRL